MKLKSEGLPVDAIAPEAAIYLTIQISPVGKKTAEGKLLETQSDVTAYILSEASLAVVPFYAFGADRTSAWYRLSVGTSKKEEIPDHDRQAAGSIAKVKIKKVAPKKARRSTRMKACISNDSYAARGGFIKLRPTVVIFLCCSFRVMQPPNSSAIG